MSGVGTDTARRAATSERRQITVLFADIAGSTAIAERMDPEDWTVIVGQAFALMNRTIEQYAAEIWGARPVPIQIDPYVQPTWKP